LLYLTERPAKKLALSVGRDQAVEAGYKQAIADELKPDLASDLDHLITLYAESRLTTSLCPNALSG